MYIPCNACCSKGGKGGMNNLISIGLSNTLITRKQASV